MMGYKDFIFLPASTGLPRKALYSNLARTSSNKLMYPEIKKIVLNEIKALKEQLKLDGEGKKKAQINMRPVFFGIINKLVMQSLFSGQKVSTEDGTTFTQVACDVWTQFMLQVGNPLSYMTFGIFNRGWIETSWLNPFPAKKKQKKLYEICMKLFFDAMKEREKRTDDQLQDNMMDNIIKEQRRRKAEGLPLYPIKDLAADVVGISFGGNDTGMSS